MSRLQMINHMATSGYMYMECPVYKW